MPAVLARVVDSSPFAVLARVVLTFVFWGAGLSKLLDFQGGVAEMAHFGLEPAVLFNVASIVTLLGGSLLVILNRAAWLGAGALAVFTALTIPLVHHFWTMTGEEAVAHFHTVTEHVTVIGALAVVTVLSRRPAAARSPSRLEPRRREAIA